MEGNIYCLQNLLNEDYYNVVIPLIQRDYAQGRQEKEMLRRNILGDIDIFLYNADSNNPEETKKLDYVYGREDRKNNNKYFYPLDGQQRLTTLWLLHWYISFKTGNLHIDKDWLSRFSYETRTSSKEFCQSLCEMMSLVNPDDPAILEYRTISDYIKDQTWFFKEWLQDPTIVSMLRTLGGEAVESKKRKADLDDIRDYLKKSCSSLLSDYFKTQKWFDQNWLNDKDINSLLSKKIVNVKKQLSDLKSDLFNLKNNGNSYAGTFYVEWVIKNNDTYEMFDFYDCLREQTFDREKCYEMCADCNSLSDYFESLVWFDSSWKNDNEINNILTSPFNDPNRYSDYISEIRKKIDDLDNYLKSSSTKEAIDFNSNIKLKYQKKYRTKDNLYDAIIEEKIVKDDIGVEVFNSWLSDNNINIYLHDAYKCKCAYDAFIDEINKKIDELIQYISKETTLEAKEFCSAWFKKNITEKDLCSRPTFFEYFKSQEWFSLDWLNDSRINELIRQIGDDCIEGVFGKYDKHKLVEMRKKLLRVKFEIIFIGTDKLTSENADDLYIKMNARGKALTHFENLKADLIAHIYQKYPSEYIIYTKLFDNDWTDILWKYIISKFGTSFDEIYDGVEDEVFFLFMNRIILDRIIVNENSVSPSDFKSQNIGKINKISPIKSFQKLYGFDKDLDESKPKDTNVTYDDFIYYEDYCDKGLLDDINTVFQFLKKVLNNEIQDLNPDIASTILGVVPTFMTDKDGNYVLNKYKKIIMRDISQSERVLFHATIQMIIEAKNTKIIDDNNDITDINLFNTNISDLIYVVNDIKDNAKIGTIDVMVTAIRKIDEIVKGCSKYKLNVYEYFNSLDVPEYKDKKESYLDIQYREEIEKAKYVISNPSKKMDIRDAESLDCCNGSIRYLYRKEDGKSVDWNIFFNKYNHVKKWFPNGKVPADTRKEFLKYYDSVNDFEKSFEEVKQKGLFKDTYSNWRNDILLDDDYSFADVVHCILSTDPNNKKSNNSFPSDGIIDFIFNRDNPEKYEFERYLNCSVIHKSASQTEYLLLGDRRKTKCDSVISSKNKGIISLDAFNEIVDGQYIYGKVIKIVYNNNEYEWMIQQTDNDYKDIVVNTNSKNETEWKDGVDIESVLKQLS